MPGAYYNENDGNKAAWLRELIRTGIVAPGEVDTRSIKEVQPEDLAGFTQCHFFAGIGVWSYALRLAGWPDDRPVWTGSCPCPSFSAAGKGSGFDDPRHLWPDWARLIRKRRPATLFGEQADDAIGYGWLDLVQTDLERENYAVGKAVLGACSVGAPHIRQRLYFVAHSKGSERGLSVHEWRPEQAGSEFSRSGETGVGQADAKSEQFNRNVRARRRCAEPANRSELGDSAVCGKWPLSRESRKGDGQTVAVGGPNILGGFWRDAEWLWCRDGKYRPVEPIAQQMADGSTESLGPLRRENIQEIEAEITTYVNSTNTDAREALHDLWHSLSQEAIRIWSTRRPSSVSEAPVLLAFMRQLSEQRWAFAEGVPRQSAQEEERFLRMLRKQEPSARPPCKRGLDRQQGRESADALHILSSILARHAQTAWGEAFQQNARDAFPLVTGAVNRVLKLRGYGDAICAEVAKAFIEAADSKGLDYAPPM